MNLQFNRTDRSPVKVVLNVGRASCSAPRLSTTDSDRCLQRQKPFRIAFVFDPVAAGLRGTWVCLAPRSRVVGQLVRLRRGACDEAGEVPGWRCPLRWLQVGVAWGR